ncbi:MAG: HDOD domain-containing protein [bacterium]|nr:HDOD domain-containing protein [bacterium]
MRSRDEIFDVLSGLKNLPTLPDAATRVIELSSDPEVSPKALADAVERDPSIATRLLKLVNSPYFGIRGTVVSIHQALVFLGVSNLRNLVLSTCAVDLFRQEGRIGSFSRSDLWIHSLATAIAARELAKSTRACDPEIAFTAGLIHDVGKIVIDRHFHEDFERIIECMDASGVAMVEAERAVFEADHSQIGFFLAKHWSLPEVLQEAISGHHAPDASSRHAKLAALIGYADNVARSLKQGDGGGMTPVLGDAFQDVLPLEDGFLAAFCSERGDELIRHIETLSGISDK